jgi:hypothetical protein
MSRIGDEALNLKTKGVMLCCLVRVVAVGYIYMWSNGGMLISKVKPKKL